MKKIVNNLLMVSFNHLFTITIKKNHDKMQWVFKKMNAAEQKFKLSYNCTQSTNFSNTPNSRVKAAHHSNTCSYAKT